MKPFLETPAHHGEEQFGYDRPTAALGTRELEAQHREPQAGSEGGC